jgi:hypothetical protein
MRLRLGACGLASDDANDTINDAYLLSHDDLLGDLPIIGVRRKLWMTRIKASLDGCLSMVGAGALRPVTCVPLMSPGLGCRPVLLLRSARMADQACAPKLSRAFSTESHTAAWRTGS